MKVKKLTFRQKKVLAFIRNKGEASNKEITKFLQDVARITVVRDLHTLLDLELIKTIGKGRSVTYREKIQNPLLAYIDPDEYFKTEPDQRDVKYPQFNFEVFHYLKDIWVTDEFQRLQTANQQYRKHIQLLSKTILKKEFERITIEFSWKSSQIEGNTYSLLDTEMLIKEHQEAPGHKREEAIMILNHKKALDYIMSEGNSFKLLTLGKIYNIHDLIISDLGITRGIRKTVVGIIGTRYKPLDNEHQIREAMKKCIHTVNKLSDPLSKALAAIVLFSYIQPFDDGNKRTARLLGNAILLSHNVCPMSFRSISEIEYKKALILFYEHNNLRYFKELFFDQFIFATSHYFLA